MRLWSKKSGFKLRIVGLMVVILLIQTIAIVGADGHLQPRKGEVEKHVTETEGNSKTFPNTEEEVQSEEGSTNTKSNSSFKISSGESTITVSTLKPTTQKPITQKSTTLKPTTPKPTTLNHTTINPTTLKPTTPKPTTLKPTTPKPTTPKPTTLKPKTPKPTTLKPTTLKPITPKPTTPKPTTLKPTTLKHTTLKPTTLKPTTPKPTTLKHTTLKPTTPKPATLKPTTLKPKTLKPTTLKHTTLKPTTPKPATLKPTTLKPTTLKPTTLKPKTAPQQTNDIATSISVSSSKTSTEITTPEFSVSTTAATSTDGNTTQDLSQNYTSTLSRDIHSVTTATTPPSFTSQGHSSTASQTAPVVMTSIHPAVSKPDKLIKIQITEIFVDKDGKEQIELKVLGNKEKLSKYSIHFFCGKTNSHYYNVQLSGSDVNEEGYLLMSDAKIQLKQYLKRNGSVSLGIYYNNPNKVNMDKEGLVDAVVIATDQTYVPANYHSLTVQFGNILITTQPSDIKNGFTAMKCSDSETWKKGRQSTLGKPNPSCRSVTTNDDKNKIKVTVAVVSTCLVIFFFIVILVIIYMRRKQEGIRHFQLSPLGDDDDELILNMEHPSEDYSPGSEPTFGNDYYSKMRKL